MPSAFKNGGLIFGIFGTIIVGYICTHCVHMLVSVIHYSFIYSVKKSEPTNWNFKRGDILEKKGFQRNRWVWFRAGDRLYVLDMLSI